MKVLRDIYRLCRDTLIVIIKWVLFLIPKDNKLVLLNAWFGEKYADNTMYLYEYLLEKTDYKAVWTTKNRNVYESLMNVGRPVVYSDSVKGIWTQIRAKVLVSTIQLSDFNQFFLSKCVYIDLDHGIPFKQAGYDIDTGDKYIEKHDKIVKRHIDYYTTATSFVCSKMIMHSYHVDQEHIILCGKPRDDLFFDEKLRIGKNNNVEEIKSGRKAIVYMPTHRDCGNRPLHLSEILNLDYLDKLCEENNCVFIVKKHFYHSKERENLDKYKNIYDITNDNVETQMLLYQADVLVSDYSSICAEYLLLDRPLVLYTFDLDDYLKNERGLFIPMDKVDTGHKVMTSGQLNVCLTSILNGEDDRFEANRKKAKELYFEPGIDFTNSRRQVVDIITQMINKQYDFSWQHYIDGAMSDAYKKEIVSYVAEH